MARSMNAIIPPVTLGLCGSLLRLLLLLKLPPPELLDGILRDLMDLRLQNPLPLSVLYASTGLTSQHSESDSSSREEQLDSEQPDTVKMELGLLLNLLALRTSSLGGWRMVGPESGGMERLLMVESILW